MPKNKSNKDYLNKDYNIKAVVVVYSIINNFGGNIDKKKINLKIKMFI